MYIENRKGTHYHKGFVDSATHDFVCLCGATQDPLTKKWSHADGSGGFKKYHNKPCEYNGILYDSTLEARMAAELDWRVKGKEITHWDRQVRISFYVCMECARLSAMAACPEHPHEKLTPLATYICDFRAHYPDGTVEYIETKGVALDVFRYKWKMMEALFGNKDDVKLTLVKEPRRTQWMFKGKNINPKNKASRMPTIQI